MTWLTWVLIVTAVLLNACAQLLLKVAARGLTHFVEFNVSTAGGSIAILSRSVPFWVGLACYGASLCLWIAALTKAPVSTAYPMLSLGYVVVTAVSTLWLGEALTPGKVIGIALICVGVVLLSRSVT